MRRVTSTAETCSRPMPALLRVAFDVHFGYHTRCNISDSGEVSRSFTAAKDVAVDTPEIVCLSGEDAATRCAANGHSDPKGFLHRDH